LPLEVAPGAARQREQPQVMRRKAFVEVTLPEPARLSGFSKDSRAPFFESLAHMRAGDRQGY
jgi:hypothetical protein